MVTVIFKTFVFEFFYIWPPNHSLTNLFEPMKSRVLLFLLCVVGITFSSCTIEKRLHRPGFHVEWKKAPSHKHVEEPTLAQHKSVADESVPANILNEEVVSASPVSNDVFASTEDVESEIIASLNERAEVVWTNNTANLDQEECETLMMTDGRKIVVKVLEINQTEIKYRKCNFEDGPVIVVNKTDVDQIVYANGAVDIISGYSNPPANQQSATGGAPKRLEVLGLLSMIFGITGLFIFGIPFGLAAVILGFSSLGKFTSRPDEFMGRGFMIAGIIIGFVAIIGMLLILAAGGV